MKYICVRHENGQLEIFTFPRSVNHDAMAKTIFRIKEPVFGGGFIRHERMPVSAGFVGPTGICCGRSETLNLDCREGDDTKLLAAQKI